LRRSLLSFVLLALARAACAAPNEIKVFTDELAPYRGETLETHVNKARTGPLRVMPEYSYGIWRDWELSLQLPLAFTSGPSVSEGYRAELQYIAPHAEQGIYWGINFEVARDFRIEEERFWNVEIIPIAGWRSGRWHLVANAGMEKPLSGASRSSTATPAAKVAYRLFGENAFGLEYYRDAGPSHMLYLAWDGKIGRSDMNLGIGHGTTANSDRWVVKAIYEFAF